MHRQNPEIHPDFREGVTHVLIKKENDTRASWKPSTLSEVTDRAIDDHFFKTPAPFDEPKVPALSLAFRADPNRRAERPYKDYPHRRYGLPRESDIRDAVSGDAPSSDGRAVTVEELTKRLEKEWNGKVGVRQKVVEVVARKCDTDKNGYLKWVS